MEILREEAVRLAEAGIRLVPVNRHLHGVTEVAYVRVHINIPVAVRAIVREVGRHVTVNIQAVTVRRIILGMEVLAYVIVVSNIRVAEPVIHPEAVLHVAENTRVVTVRVDMLGTLQLIPARQPVRIVAVKLDISFILMVLAVRMY